MSFTVDVDLEQPKLGCLTAKISTSLGATPDAECFFYLLRFGRVVSRSGWVSDFRHDFEIAQSGAYSVQAHVRRAGINISRKTSQVFVMAPCDEPKYARWLSSAPVRNPLPLYKVKYPFADLLIDVRGRGSPDCLKDLGFKGRSGRPGARELIFACDVPRVFAGREVYFSGVARADGSSSLIVGCRDISLSTDLVNAIGSWTAISVYDDRIDISADVGGVCRWYRLRCDGADIIANSYHLLLLYAERAGVRMKLGEREVLASLAFTGLQPLHQLYGQRLPVCGAEMVLPDRFLRVSPSGEVAELFNDLRSALDTCEAHNSAIDELKSAAAAEIEGNVELVMSDPRFGKVLCDLSGGLDSRTVFSALTTLPSGKVKAVVHARASSREPLDHVVACKLNSFYQVPYDDLTTKVTPNDECTPWADHWSFYLGTYYSYRPALMKKRHDDDVVRLVGFYGEVCLRDYYSRSVRGSELDVDGTREFVDRYVERNATASLIVGPGLVDAARETLLDALEAIPGRRPADKFENHYIYYRNGLHCSPALRSDYSALEWGPLQSLSALKVKTMGFASGPAVQLEIISKLNPLLAQVPYQDDADERSRREARPTGSPWLDNIDMNLDVDLQPWEDATRRKKENEDRPQMSPAFYAAVREDKQRMLERALQALRYVRHERGADFDPISRSAWYVLSSAFEESYGGHEINCVNRIVSLATQLDIIRGSDGV